jgi:hypothetical protein
MNFGESTEEEIKKNNNDDKIVIHELKDNIWRSVYAQIDGIVQKPGIYTLYTSYEGRELYLGEVQFFYVKTPPYTIEQLRAIDSNPYSTKSVRALLGCKLCSTKIITYCSLERNINDEDEGCIWYKELPDMFSCECGTSTYSLEYFKEGIPNLLGRDISIGQWSYERRYSHEKIENIIREFNKVLRENKDESPLQKFIEDNLVMLAKFYAKEIFLKPSINGKYFADFAILNATNEVVFIEIERPSLQLFKKTKKEQGYLTADLMHAYDQIRSWQDEYRKFPQSFLDKLSLKLEDVMATKWVVIAGRKGREKAEHLQRHLAKPIYDTEFLTYDDLASSLRQISRELP